MINGPWYTNGTTFTKTDKYRTIEPEAYEDWKRQFTADALLGQRYGQSFCNFFSVEDNLLFFTREIDWCERYIKDKYLARQ